MIKLSELNPHWVGAGGEGISDKDGNPVPYRANVAILFDCPCGCSTQVLLTISNPLGGAEPIKDDRHTWERTGDTFETLTLTPSFRRASHCGYHGWVTSGEVKEA